MALKAYGGPIVRLYMLKENMKKGIELRVVGIGLVIAGVLVALAGPARLVGQEASEAAKPMRLKLKVLKTYPQPVIDEKTPGVEGIKGGYECGNTVKVMIDNRFVCVTTNWQAGSTLWRARSKVEGVKGIRGPWDFPGKQFMVPGTSYPKQSVAQSVTAPFQVKDGRWAVLMGGNGSPYQPKYGSWWVLVSTAPTPQGPYTFDEKHSPATMIDPTGGIENPTVTKVRGPLTGREYWVSTFDFLHPQPNNAIGFTWSRDGLDWPMANGQALVIDEGLAPGETGWWKGTIGTWSIRTPHQLIDEGDGTYTVFFTGSTQANYFTGFRAVGRMRVRLVEEPVAHE